MRDVKNTEIQNDEAENAQIANNTGSDATAREDRYLTTVEAARHMRRSVSWILRQKDIPYYRGKPNLYLVAELDSWFEANRRYEPLSFRGRS
jgi:hypothetical protein